MAAERTIPPTSKLLGEYLDCSREDIEEALSRQSTAEEGERQRVGELLLDAGSLDMEQLLGAVQAQRVDRLRACRLFESLSESELAELSAVFQEVTVARGAQFITQDERDPSVYVLAAGSCKVVRSEEGGNEIPLARLFPGEPVGEMGYFADGIRSASVQALDTVQLLRALYEDLTDCFETVPAVAGAFMEVITQRLRYTNLLYQEAQYQEPSERPSSHLDELLEGAQTGDLEEGVDRLLVRMVHSASRLTDADRATLFLIDPESRELWSKVAQGAEINEIRVPSGTGVVGWAVDNNELLNIEEAYDDDRFNPDVDKRTGYRTRTILCAPVRGTHNRVLGAVQVINKQFGIFNDDDESLLRAFAAQAAVAVENINLFRDVVRNYRRLGLLLDITTRVVQSKDPASLSGSLGARLAERFACERAQVFLLDADTDELWCTVPNGDVDEQHRYSLSDVVAGHALVSGESVNIPDTFDDERFEPAVDERDGFSTRCLLAVPLKDDEGRLRGALQLSNRINGIFGADDADLLALVAAQIGLSAFFDE